MKTTSLDSRIWPNTNEYKEQECFELFMYLRCLLSNKAS